MDTDGNIFDPTKIDTNCKQTHKRSASKRKLSKDDEAEKAKQLKLLDESVSSLPTLYSAVSIIYF